MNIIIEASKNGRHRYEKRDINSSILFLRSTGEKWFANYGYVEGTLQKDGDELDAFVIGKSYPVGSRVKCKCIGVLRVKDDGEEDDKLFCIPVNDKHPTKRYINSLIRVIRNKKSSAIIGLYIDDPDIIEILIKRRKYGTNS